MASYYTEPFGYAGGYGDAEISKACAAEKLVSVAESCGIEKDAELFKYVIGVVYSESRRINIETANIGEISDVIARSIEYSLKDTPKGVIA